MRRLTGLLVIAFCGAFVWMGVTLAQFGRGGGWMTAGGDAQRSFWLRTDPKISRDSMLKPGFQFLWKLKLNNQPIQLNSLTPAITLEGYIGYRGFRTLGYVGGSSDNIFAIDTDLGRLEWEKHLSPGSPQQGASPGCPGGMTAELTRPAVAAFPAAPAARGGAGGRAGPARSGAGQPGEGAVTIAAAAARAGAAGPPGRAGAPAAPGAPATPGGARGPGNAGRGPGGGRGGPNAVYAISSDGKLHSVLVSNGADTEPPIDFLPANANAHGLIVIDNVAYAATAKGCGGAPNGLWALDLASKQVGTWKSNGGGILGSVGPAVGPDGTLYVATEDGDLVALEAKNLKQKDSYSTGKQGLTTSPVIFPSKEKTLLAVTSRDGRLHLLDSAALGGSGNQTPLFRTPAYSNAADFVPGALASWEDSAGTRWVLAPTAGPLASDAGFTTTNGNVTNGAVVAWKVVDQNGSPTLQPGWVSRDLMSPLTPMVINGVVFAVSSGEFRSSNDKLTAAERAQRSSPAILYALDGSTGKELWNSGKTMTSFVHGGGLSGGGSQLYLGTYDGTFYAFGFWIEH
jgi:outer membrane protein assembly factor BamB